MRREGRCWSTTRRSSSCFVRSGPTHGWDSTEMVSSKWSKPRGSGGLAGSIILTSLTSFTATSQLRFFRTLFRLSQLGPSPIGSFFRSPKMNLLFHLCFTHRWGTSGFAPTAGAFCTSCTMGTSTIFSTVCTCRGVERRSTRTFRGSVTGSAFTEKPGAWYGGRPGAESALKRQEARGGLSMFLGK